MAHSVSRFARLGFSTLRATLAWSYHLLAPGEQQLFRWLAVFVGGCTLQAIEAIARPASLGASTVLEGVSALLAFDAGENADVNTERMSAAIVAVRAVELTRAVRDSTADGHDIKEGDVIAVVDDRITQVGDDYSGVLESVLADEPREPELITVYHGEDVSADDADQLVAGLRAKHPAIEFEVHSGGQEHYPYVLSLE